MRASTFISTAAVFTAITSAKIIEDPTKAEFDECLTNNDRLFVAFTSRTTKSVSSFNDAFTAAGKDSTITFTTINCDQEPDLCHDYEINSYPTIRFFQKAQEEKEDEEDTIQMTRYRGPRTKQALYSFALKQALPPLSHIQAPNFPTFKEIDDTVIIAFLRPDQQTLLETFTTVATRHHHSFVFGYTTDAATADAENLSIPSIAIYKNTDNDHKIANGHFTKENLETLLSSAKQHAIRTFRERDIDSFMVRDKLTLYIFAAANEATTTQLRRALTPLARKYEQYVVFAMADIHTYRDMAGGFGVDVADSEQPALVVHAPMNDNVFLYRRGSRIEVGGVEEMLMTILEGKARNGQVFGKGEEEEEGIAGHDEL